MIKRNGESFSITGKELNSYCEKRDGSPIDTEKILAKMVGKNFTKKAYACSFALSRE